MKLPEIFRFEFAYQIRRPWPWLGMAMLGLFAFFNTRVAVVPATLPQDFILNSPFVIATVTVFSCFIWLLIGSAISGEAGARDMESGIHPLMYTLPQSRGEYLGGRFLAALALNALMLLAVQAGGLLAAFAPGVNPAIIGPFRPTAYLAAYCFIALPNAIIATAVQFTLAQVSGRSMAGYLGSMILGFLSVPLGFVLMFIAGEPALAKLLDPLGFLAIMNAMMMEWTIVEKNIRMFTLEGPMLWNRLFWLGISLTTLGVLHVCFRFRHRAAFDPWSVVARMRPRRADAAPVPGNAPVRARTAVSVPQVRQSFGLSTRVRQTLAIAGASFRMLAGNPAGLFMLAAFPMFVVLVLLMESQHWQVPLLLRTSNILNVITSPVTSVTDFRVMMALVVLYFAGELVWRERDAGISENIDATSVPEWVLYGGKFLGLGLLLVAYVASLTAAGLLAQVIRGYHDFQIGLYLQVMFGLQLPEYLLLAVLALLVHTVVNQKHVGLLAAIFVYMLMVLGPWLGIEHNLLIYSAGPSWSYTDMRGFGASLGPWLWFKLYWASWALLLAVVTRLLWVRGREAGFRMRLQTARRRMTRTTSAVAMSAVVLILALGGFIFYNTNVLHEYRSSAESDARAAEYERRYGRYEGIPQPVRKATKLHIEIYPDRGAATMRGNYVLVNRAAVPIDSIHLETLDGVETEIAFDRAATAVVQDDELDHSIYALREPLQPGDSLVLEFALDIEPRGFRHGGAASPVTPEGTHFTGRALPVIGYQPGRELIGAADRHEHGLPRQVTFSTPDDVAPEVATGNGATFEAVMGTVEDQVAVAPGVLRRSWTEGGRRYFHYSSDVPIVGQFMFFSADYTVHRERWKHVDIQVYNDPRHTELRERMLRSVRASLAYMSEEFGPYPYDFLQIIEQPAPGMGMGVDGSGVITALEGFFSLDPQDDDVDAVFQITAHEMGHQWWGVQLNHAWAEGAIILSEGLAWYSAMQVVKKANGPDQLRRFMSFMRQRPPIRTGLPLLRAMDPWAGYRKAPYALYALSEYMGEDRVNGALASLLRKKRDERATTLDLYRELQAVMPDSLKYLLHDLFESDTFWELDVEAASAVQIAPGTEQAATGAWLVTLNVRARKVVSDSAGVETELPMDEWVPIGVFARGAPGDELSAPLYLKMHRIRSGEQTITVTVPGGAGPEGRPSLAGIDPHHLLDWVENDDDSNIAGVRIEERS